jgi:hypothetical protein
MAGYAGARREILRILDVDILPTDKSGGFLTSRSGFLLHVGEVAHGTAQRLHRTFGCEGVGGPMSDLTECQEQLKAVRELCTAFAESGYNPPLVLINAIIGVIDGS